MVSTTEHEQSRAILNSCVQEWISELGAHLKVAVNNEFDLRPISVIFEQTVASPWFDNQTTPWSVHLPRISGVSLDNWKRAVLHELGHAVYRQIFESKVTKIDIFNQWSETYMKERMKRRVAELTLLTQQESTLKKSLEDQTCVLTCHTETETRLQSTRREIAKSLERIPFQILLSAQMGGISAVDNSYQELFADAVVVDMLADDRANADSIQAFALAADVADTDSEYRDFSRQFSVKGWPKETDHLLFTPTRSYLGKRLGSKKFKAHWLKTFVGTILSEIRRRETERDFDSLPEELNRKLISALNLESK